MTFLVIDHFLTFSTLPSFSLTHDDSYFLLLHPLTPSIHTHMLFFTFLRLALCSRNNKYPIRHLVLLNSSLHKQPFITAHFRSSLHNILHHCTIKQALGGSFLDHFGPDCHASKPVLTD